MARLVTKFKYIKPGKNAGCYLKYIATREGVEKIDDTKRLNPVTKKQKELINKIVKDFPDSKDMLEYQDYQKYMNVGFASEFITRAIEDNANIMMNKKTYADYIATRPNAERVGTHGLFTDDGEYVNLSKVSEDLNKFEGNVWTTIISLHREDAIRLGFDKGIRWRDMLRTQTQALSESLRIPLEHLRWFAAFHNESHHPHVHLIAYSTVAKEGYLTKKGVHDLRASLAKDIFAQDLFCIYEKQTKYRNKLRTESKDHINQIISAINSGIYENQKIEQLIQKLSYRLSKTKGKKVYGYLKADVKAIVNAIVDELSKDKRIDALYDLWYEQKEETILTYNDTLPERVALSQNKEFKCIKNMVIQEAIKLKKEEWQRTIKENMDISKIENIIDPPDQDEFIEKNSDSFSGEEDNEENTWWTDNYLAAKRCLYGSIEKAPDFQRALILFEEEAEKGNGFAMQDYGKMLLLGVGCEKNEQEAQKWFKSAYYAFLERLYSAKRPSGYLQYRIGKLFAMGYGVKQSYYIASSWYQEAVDNKSVPAAYSLGSMYRRGKGIPQNDYYAFELFTKAATDYKRPNAYAQFELGQMYKEGSGTTIDEEKSKEWYQSAYEGFLELEINNMADDRLYYRLGSMNMNGIGTETNFLKARDYFEKAAQLDNTDAMYGLGLLYLKDWEKKDISKAIWYLTEAANKGNDFAQYMLGKIFYQGKSVQINMEYAIYWLEKAQQNGNTQAKYMLGKMLLYGEYMQQDIARGKLLLNQASDKGNAHASYILGKELLQGNILPQNIERAIELLNISSKKGFESAQYLLGKTYYQGILISKDISLTISYLTAAAENGYEYAQYLLGKVYLEICDNDNAIYWLTKAANQGNYYAQYCLGTLYLFDPEKRDKNKALFYLTLAADQGNQYAEQLLYSIKQNRNHAATLCSLCLIQNIGQIFKERIDDKKKMKSIVDMMLRRKIDDKKQAQGIRD